MCVYVCVCVCVYVCVCVCVRANASACLQRIGGRFKAVNRPRGKGEIPSDTNVKRQLPSPRHGLQREIMILILRVHSNTHTACALYVRPQRSAF
jgi:hypothetical protein